MAWPTQSVMSIPVNNSKRMVWFPAWTSGGIQTKSYGFALKENFCRFLYPFLIYRTGFMVILRDSKIQLCGPGSFSMPIQLLV